MRRVSGSVFVYFVLLSVCSSCVDLNVVCLCGGGYLASWGPGGGGGGGRRRLCCDSQHLTSAWAASEWLKVVGRMNDRSLGSVISAPFLIWAKDGAHFRVWYVWCDAVQYHPSGLFFLSFCSLPRRKRCPSVAYHTTTGPLYCSSCDTAARGGVPIEGGGPRGITMLTGLVCVFCPSSRTGRVFVFILLFFCFFLSFPVCCL